VKPPRPSAEADQEARQPLARGLAAEQQHLLLGGRELVGGTLQKRPLHRREAIQGGEEPATVEAAHPGLVHGLGAVDVDAARGEAEEVTRQREPRHLPTPLEQLVELERTAGHGEDLVGAVALVEQDLARPERAGAHQQCQRRELLGVQGRADREVARPATLAGRLQAATVGRCDDALHTPRPSKISRLPVCRPAGNAPN
jgi:hypothetical protein